MLGGPRVARAAAAAIALMVWLGLVVQFDASLDLIGSAGGALWVMLRYFTVIANLLVALVLTRIAFSGWASTSPELTGCVTLAIVLVGVVYGLLLRGLLELSGGAKLANFILHVAAPILVPLFWLLFAPKGGLRRRDPWLWAILPAAYFAYALVRGGMEGVYAYPFLNVARIGWGRTVVTGLLMAAAFIVAGFMLVWLDSHLARRARAQSG